MAKSRIVERSRIPRKRVTDQAVQLISAWCHRELASFKNSKIPLILPLEHGGYIIDHQRLVPVEDHWQLQDFDGSPRTWFGSKRAGIFYCLACSAGQLDQALEIAAADQEMSWLAADIVHYLRSKKPVSQARLNDARFKLSHARKRLENSIARTKYMKR